MVSGRLLRAMGLALCLCQPVAAQDLFSPAIVVNDRAVTGFELQQRALLLRAFNTPGDVEATARRQLVEERLKDEELTRAGVTISDEALGRAIEDFASRANLSAAEFTAELGKQGIEPETLRDYVRINTAWRDYVRQRFADAITVTDAEIDRAIAQEDTQAQGIEVLLSEVVIPAPPGQEAEVRALAERLSAIRSTGDFEAAARQYSATRSREQGGRLDWTPLSNYPAALQEILLGLAPGEVTPPLPVTGAVALLQLRDIREGAAAEAQPETIDYAQVRIAGASPAAAQAEAQRIAGRVETCTDLFGLGIPDASITRDSVPAAQVPPDVALDIASLDPGELTWGRTTPDGRTLLLTMLCARGYGLPEGAADREAVANALRNEKLAGQADVLVARLRAAATIVGE